jgi:N-acetylmuramoyl-L-alanine amidase
MANLRSIRYIVVHCTATPVNTTVESIKRYWKEQRGWEDVPGYHYLILRDGTIIQLLDERQNSNGVYQHNFECVNIAYIGGIDKDGQPIDNRSEAQCHAMFNKIVALTERYPKAQVLGHRDFPEVKKACPCFDVRSWLQNYEPEFKQRA